MAKNKMDIHRISECIHGQCVALSISQWLPCPGTCSFGWQSYSILLDYNNGDTVEMVTLTDLRGGHFHRLSSTYLPLSSESAEHSKRQEPQLSNQNKNINLLRFS